MELNYNTAEYERRIKSEYPIIDDIIWDCDLDDPGLSLCFLKAPYLSPSSNGGYFHFYNEAELLEQLSNVRLLTRQEIEKNWIGLVGNYSLNTKEELLNALENALNNN